MSVGDLDTFLTQPPLPKCGQIPHEWEGGLLDVCLHVHRKGTNWWQNVVQRLSNKTGRSHDHVNLTVCLVSSEGCDWSGYSTLTSDKLLKLLKLSMSSSVTTLVSQLIPHLLSKYDLNINKPLDNQRKSDKTFLLHNYSHICEL